MSRGEIGFQEETKLLHFPVLEGDCCNFVVIGLPCPKLSSRERGNIMASFDSLKILESRFVTPQIMNSPPLKFTSEQLLIIPPVLRYAVQLRYVSYAELCQEEASINMQFLQKIRHITEFLNFCLDNSIPFECSTQSLLDFFEKTKESSLSSLKFQVNSLDFFIRRMSTDLFTICDRPLLNLGTILCLVKKAQCLVAKELEYCPSSDLDVPLVKFMQAFRLDERASGLAKALNFSSNIDPNPLKKFISEFAKAMNIDDPGQYLVIESAILRYIFETSYIINPQTLTTTDNGFLNKCKLMKRLTPKQMSLSKNLIPDNMMDSPISEVTEKYEPIRSVIAAIWQIQMQANPFDMMAAIVMSLKKIEDMVRSSEASKEGDQEWELMSFDDCFSLFLMALCVDPPINSVAISNYLEKSSTLEVSLAMQYGRTIFVTAIDHILEFNEERVEG